MVRWPGEIDFFQAYREVAECVHFGLRRLGHDSLLSEHRIDQDRVNIVFGFHIFDPDSLGKLPPPTVLYNLEQVLGRDLRPAFYAIGDGFPVWDYSERNCDALRRLGIERVVHVPIGFVPELVRIAPAPEQDIDVLFYGMVEERRARILQAVRDTGLRVEVLAGVYGARRDAHITRAKVVLNLHLYETRIFEVARVSYLLANSKAVVAERGQDTEIEDDFERAVVVVRPEDVPAACVRLVADDDLRHDIERQGRDIMAARDECVYLREALELTFPAEHLR